MSRNQQAEEKLLFQYLLGSLPEEQQVQIEDRAFADQAYLAELQAAEADLIDAYVRGGLAPAERRDFEQMFLASPQRRGKVAFARTLARLADDHASLPAQERPSSSQALVSAWVNLFRGWNPAFQLAAGLATVIFVAGISWLVIRDRELSSRLTAAQDQSSALVQQAEGLRRQLDEERSRSPKQLAAPIASLVLVPGISRAESRTVQLMMDPAAQLARIEIQLESRDDYPQFRAELRNAAGTEILVRSQLRSLRNANGLTVTLDIPASALPSGQYELALKGFVPNERVKDIGYYYFTVQPK
jgi:hypothetical protein